MEVLQSRLARLGTRGGRVLKNVLYFAIAQSVGFGAGLGAIMLWSYDWYGFQ